MNTPDELKFYVVHCYERAGAIDRLIGVSDAA